MTDRSQEEQEYNFDNQGSPNFGNSQTPYSFFDPGSTEQPPRMSEDEDNFSGSVYDPSKSNYIQPPLVHSNTDDFRINPNINIMPNPLTENVSVTENFEDEKRTILPPTNPLPVSPQIDESEPLPESNFGFTADHGVTYGHGPNGKPQNTFGLPPTGNNNNEFFNEPPRFNQPRVELEQQSELPPPNFQRTNELPVNLLPPETTTTEIPQYNFPPRNEEQPPLRPPDSSQPSNEIPPIQPTSQYETKRHYGNEANFETTCAPGNLPQPHHSKFNEELPPPDVSGQFIGLQRSLPNIDLSKLHCSPCYMRSTIRAAPNTPSLLTKFGLPFGVIMQPFCKGENVPLVNLGFTEIIRCFSCRCYINPFCTFIERGYKWKCNLCKTINDVPKCYFSKLNESGVRHDIMSHPELLSGSIEFVAPKRYHTNLTGNPTCFIFMLDVSRRSVYSGALKKICESISKKLNDLPSGGRTKIGLITFNKQLHFYSLRGNQPKMFVVGELSESLLPLPKDLLVSLQDGKNCLKKLLKMIPSKLFVRSKKNKNPLLDSISSENAMFSALRSAHRLVTRSGGKLLIFLSSIPTVGRNKLSSRKKITIQKQLEPVKLLYKEMALDFSKKSISVDLFTIDNISSNNVEEGEIEFDLGTLIALPKYTSGNHFHNVSLLDLEKNINICIDSICGFDAVLRVRVSQGLKIKDFFGNFFIKGHDLLALPYCDSLKGFGVELEHGGSFISSQNVCVQAAVLYSLPNGERRIRVHNLVLPVTSSLPSLYSHCDVYTSVSLLLKQVTDEIHRKGFEAQREKLINHVAMCIRTYRNEVKLLNNNPANFSNSSKHEQIILADSIRLLPLYTLAVLKHFSLAITSSFVDKNIGSDVPNEGRKREFLGLLFSGDQRSSAIQSISASPTRDCILKIHPEIYQIDLSSTPSSESNLLIPLTRSVIKENHMYLVNDGVSLKCWITGKEVNNEFLKKIEKKIKLLNSSILLTLKKKSRKSKKEEEEALSEENSSEAHFRSSNSDDESGSDSGDSGDEEEREEEEEEEHPVIKSFTDLVEFQRKKYYHKDFVVELVTPERISAHNNLIFKLIDDCSIDQKSGKIQMCQTSYDRFIVELHDKVVMRK